MIRRLIVLLAAGGVLYFLYTRFFRSPPVLVDEDWDLDVESPPPPAPAETNPAPVEPERIRALVGSDDTAAPTPAGAAPEPAADADTGDAVAESDTPIKGNIREDGEKIYHLPGDPAYARTKAEQLFATPEEAEAAGFRRAGHPRE